MGKRGPKPKPTKLRVFEGNPGRKPIDGNEADPTSAPDVPEPPEGLKEIGRKYWRRIAGHLHATGLLTNLDVDMLFLLCSSWEMYWAAERLIETEGMIAISEKGGAYQHPAVGIRNKSYEQIKQVSGLFGMAPASRVGLNVNFDKGGGDDFETFEDVG